jgi:multiple sugar transport system substrate-binding protein
MLRTKETLAAVAASALAPSVSAANAQHQELTLCWAAWDPANALAELSKDFTAESGIKMNFEFVPWTKSPIAPSMSSTRRASCVI